MVLDDGEDLRIIFKLRLHPYLLCYPVHQDPLSQASHKYHKLLSLWRESSIKTSRSSRTLGNSIAGHLFFPSRSYGMSMKIAMIAPGQPSPTTGHHHRTPSTPGHHYSPNLPAFPSINLCSFAQHLFTKMFHRKHTKIKASAQTGRTSCSLLLTETKENPKRPLATAYEGL